MLKVWNLKSMLSLVPDDAVVKIRHELVGDDQFAESLYYEKTSNTVYIREMNDATQSFCTEDADDTSDRESERQR